MILLSLPYIQFIKFIYLKNLLNFDFSNKGFFDQNKKIDKELKVFIFKFFI
jgi:hypothetical protein